MSNFKDKTFTDRRTSANEAMAARLAKFRAKPAPDDPEVLAREAARKAVLEAREIRTAERAVAKAELLAREAEEQAARALVLEAEKAAAVVAAAEAEIAKKAAQNERASRVMADEAARKAERDERYAARKARKKG